MRYDMIHDDMKYDIDMTYDDMIYTANIFQQFNTYDWNDTICMYLWNMKWNVNDMRMKWSKNKK